MKRNSKNTGITLIALVITIIVLLILAGITLSTLAGRRGIIKQAQSAETEHNKGAAQEEIIIVTMQSLDNKGNMNTTKLETGLNDIGATIKSKGTRKWKVEHKGYGFEIGLEEGDVVAKDITGSDAPTLAEMYKNAEADGCDGTNCIVTDHLHIGDFVDYKPDTNTSGYNLLASKSGNFENVTITQEDLYWRVWGYDESTDEVILVSNRPTNQGVDFSGFVGYNNYETELNNICKELYSSSNIGTARSMNMEDIEKVSSYTEAQKIADMGDSTKEGGIGYTKTFTDCYYPDPSSSTGESQGTKTFTCDAYSYTATNYITNTKQLELLEGTDGNVTIIADGPYSPFSYIYCLASRFVRVRSSNAIFCCSGVFEEYVRASLDSCCSSDGNIYNGNGSVHWLRPVIHLKSEVTEEQVPIIEAQTDTWNAEGYIVET